MKSQWINTRTCIALFTTILCCFNAQAVTPAVSPSDYLILQNIGEYHNSGKGRCGDGPGFLGAADHYGEDHGDTTCRTGYYNMAQDLAVSILVTKHADSSDAIKWLLHEVEDAYRDPDVLEATLTEGARIREIAGNRIFFYGGGVVSYRWLSNNIVVNIQYANLSGPKAEPLEVVKAYLAKHPSNVTLSDVDLKSKPHSEQWIKDEMDRRLWLCDKWFMQLQLRKADEKQVYQETVKSMNIFLDYREKYYRMKAADDKNLLAGYLSTNSGTGIKAKLAEYKNWWAVNKGGSITLP